MKTLTHEQAASEREAAMDRYRAAVAEFRQSYAALHALDNLTKSGGFGSVPDVVLLRHGTANPGESGSLQADIAQIIQTTQIDG